MFLVIKLTTGTTTRDTAIAITPISGDFDAALLKLEVKEITSVAPPTVRSPEMMPANAPIFVIFFEKSPQMYGPIKHPETIPQENDIRLTIIGMFCVANINEQATKARHSILVRVICFFGEISFLLTAGIKSTATADADVSTTASSVDIDAERSNIIIIASKIIPNVPLPRTFIKSVGITASIPPSGNTPPRISLDVLPIKYAPQPITRQKIVEIIVPLFIAALSLIA